MNYFKDRISLSNILLLLSVLICFYLLIHYFYLGVTTLPTEGDSLNIHIPIAKSILNGGFLHPNLKKIYQLSPSSNEVFIATLMKLNIPLNLYNVFAEIVLFFALIYVGIVFKLEKKYALLYSLSFCSLYGVLRWVPTQKIDIWLLVYFLFTLSLLKKPRNSIFYYLILGFSSGMLLGSKFSAPSTLCVLILFYIGNFFKFINFKNLVVFFIMVGIFGGFWYFRNAFITGNPFYPQAFLFFKGSQTPDYTLAWQIWKSIILFPKEMINAFISEYMIWSTTFIVLPIFLLFTYFTKSYQKYPEINKLILLGIANFILYLFFPSYKHYQDMVFGVRYTFPVISVFMLAAFILAKRFKKQQLLFILSFANMSFLILPVTYHPKLLYLYVPFFALLIFLLSKIFNFVLKYLTESQPNTSPLPTKNLHKK